jgi:HAD superfamily hydrolase (TIGR01450 family)
MAADGTKPGTVVLDLDGVLYVDTEGVPGAAAALHAVRATGHRLLFVTNNATKTAETVVRHLSERTGFTADPDDVVTSGSVTAMHLAGSVKRVYVLGEPALEEAMRFAGLAPTAVWQQAEAVVVGLDRGLSYERLAGAVLAVRAGARFVATNADTTYPTPQGLYPGGGAIAAAVAAATGVDPEVCGKPHEPMRAAVRSLVGDGPVWVVGDRIETDLAMATAEGWLSVLVLTGVDGRAELTATGFTPDLVLDSVASLPAALVAGV